MKPEDMVVGDQPALLGDKGCFGAPCESVGGVDTAKGTLPATVARFGCRARPTMTWP